VGKVRQTKTPPDLIQGRKMRGTTLLCRTFTGAALCPAAMLQRGDITVAPGAGLAYFASPAQLQGHVQLYSACFLSPGWKLSAKPAKAYSSLLSFYYFLMYFILT